MFSYQTTASVPHAAHLLSAHLYAVLLGEGVALFFEPKGGASGAPAHFWFSMGAALAFPLACGAQRGVGAALERYACDLARLGTYKGLDAAVATAKAAMMSNPVEPVAVSDSSRVPASRKRPRPGSKAEKEEEEVG